MGGPISLMRFYNAGDKKLASLKCDLCGHETLACIANNSWYQYEEHRDGFIGSSFIDDGSSINNRLYYDICIKCQKERCLGKDRHLNHMFLKERRIINKK